MPASSIQQCAIEDWTHNFDGDHLQATSLLHSGLTTQYGSKINVHPLNCHCSMPGHLPWWTFVALDINFVDTLSIYFNRKLFLLLMALYIPYRRGFYDHFTIIYDDIIIKNLYVERGVLEWSSSKLCVQSSIMMMIDVNYIFTLFKLNRSQLILIFISSHAVCVTWLNWSNLVCMVCR